jgi:hypothetical protein
MKKLILLFLGISVLNIATIRADEGMWLLSLIGKNYEQMKAQGFRLTPEDIYNVNKSCLKDAVVGLGKEGNPFWHFCTGEIVSRQGLFTTNHHCGFDMIQNHSSVENDYLRDGFWAMSMIDELPNEGITASILVNMADVTDSIFSKLDEKMNWQDRQVKIREISDTLIKKAVEGTQYEAQVVDMFASNQFFLLVYITYKDIRLVGAPPSSMGKFGGDTDNWEWPRHTADFSMFRIYTDKDGNPASYSADNVPLKPKHHFPISIKGIKDGDFAMVMGFPGTTERFLTSYGLEQTINVQNRLIHDIRSVKIDVLRKEMAANQKVKIQYATKYATCSNYWKYAKQQNKALKQLNTMAVKREIEANYLNWAKQQNNENYTSALTKIKDGYKANAKAEEAQLYIAEGILTGPELPLFAFSQINAIAQIIYTDDVEFAETQKNKFVKKVDNFYKNFDINVEQKLLVNMVEYVYKNLAKEYYPKFLTDVLVKKFKGNVPKFVDYILKNTMFSSKEKVLSALDDKKLRKTILSEKPKIDDAAFELGSSALEMLRYLYQSTEKASENMEIGEHYFVDGILQINKDKLIAPDANSTIRLTYGNVFPYKPRDGVFYNYYTTLKGVMEKEDATNTEFVVPEKLKTLFKNKNYGQYADKNGEVPVCFITNNDITGGNSGSPVIDADGNLIGLAFDGNSEAMSGDIDFEENMQRCINLDVRYMLFIIDKFAGCNRLIDEMTIVK